MTYCHKALPRDIRQILGTLSEILAPPVQELQMEGIKEKIVADADRLIFEFPLFFRIGLIWGTRFFNWLPFLFGFGLTTFLLLSLESQKKYVEGWTISKIVVKREFFKTLKAFILLVYFSDKRVWQYIGYDPEPHMQERIKLREDILKRDVGAR